MNPEDLCISCSEETEKPKIVLRCLHFLCQSCFFRKINIKCCLCDETIDYLRNHLIFKSLSEGRNPEEDEKDLQGFAGYHHQACLELCENYPLYHELKRRYEAITYFPVSSLGRNCFNLLEDAFDLAKKAEDEIRRRYRFELIHLKEKKRCSPIPIEEISSSFKTLSIKNKAIFFDFYQLVQIDPDQVLFIRINQVKCEKASFLLIKVHEEGDFSISRIITFDWINKAIPRSFKILNERIFFFDYEENSIGIIKFEKGIKEEIIKKKIPFPILFDIFINYKTQEIWVPVSYIKHSRALAFMIYDCKMQLKRISPFKGGPVGQNDFISLSFDSETGELCFLKIQKNFFVPPEYKIRKTEIDLFIINSEGRILKSRVFYHGFLNKLTGEAISDNEGNYYLQVFEKELYQFNKDLEIKKIHLISPYMISQLNFSHPKLFVCDHPDDQIKEI